MKQKLKKIIKILTIMIATILAILSFIVTNFFIHLKEYNPTESSDFYSPYYVYTSSKAAKISEDGGVVNILIVPNNTASTSDDIKVHKRFALLQAFVSHIIFKELNTIILVPAFPRTQEQWNIYTHALDRDTLLTEVKELSRTDLQLNSMVDETINRLNLKGYKVNSQCLLFGHSASGMFVNRYTILHPDKVSAAAVFAPGGWAIAPIKNYHGNNLRYPVGIDDVYELTGSDFDLDAYEEVSHFFVIGSEDTNDSVPYTDSYEDEDRNLINILFGKTPIERWEKSKIIYDEILQDVDFKTYEGMGHVPSIEAFRDTIEFFEIVLENN